MAKNPIGFEFPLDHSQQWDGFNEPGVEHFAGSPFRSLGREGTQNTADAAREAPARIAIRRIDVPVASIPDFKGLRATIASCQSGAATEGEKAAAFFDRAVSVLDKSKVSILQFADHGTKGVRGPCENGTPYFALMKATGQSKKDSGTAGGSFGIGKFAPYTVSDLRTVFLTTVWEDATGMIHHNVQGKSILMSHHDGEQIKRDTGFWGIKKNCQPVEGFDVNLPDWLRRSAMNSSDTGTTLSILGFAPQKNWERILAASIAESFFCAIARGALEVSFDAGLALTSSTIAEFLADESIDDDIADQKDEPETFQNSSSFLDALASEQTITEDSENANLGHCRIHILVAEGLPKRVAILRNGMLITSEMAKLRRFPDMKDFAAVVECLSDKGNAMLRAMEPPAHNDFEPDRLNDLTTQRAGRVALRELAKWIKEMLKRHAQDPVAEVTDIDELSEFFGDEEGANDAGTPNGDIDPSGKLKIRARPLPKRKSSQAPAKDGVASQEEGDEAQAGDTEADGQGGENPVNHGEQGGANGGKTADGKDSDTATANKAGSGLDEGQASTKPTSGKGVAVSNFRAVVVSDSIRQVSFTPAVAGDVEIRLEDSGADTNRPLPVLSASSGVVVNGVITVKCLAGSRMTFDVGFEQPFLVRFGSKPMQFDSLRAFPYPVLRADVDDYVDGAMQVAVDMSPSEDGQQVSAEIHFQLSVEELRAEIVAGRAQYVVVVSFRDTYFRIAVSSKDEKFSTDFPPGALRGEVQIFPYISALKPIKNFKCPWINPEFGSGPFSFEVGAVLALEEPQALYIDRDVFRPLSSVFVLVKDDAISSHEWQLRATDNKVQIVVSPELKEKLDAARNNKAFRAVLMNSIYFSAVMQCVAILKKDYGGESEASDSRWGNVILQKCANSGLDLVAMDEYLITERLMKSPFQLVDAYLFQENET